MTPSIDIPMTKNVWNKRVAEWTNGVNKYDLRFNLKKASLTNFTYCFADGTTHLRKAHKCSANPQSVILNIWGNLSKRSIATMASSNLRVVAVKSENLLSLISIAFGFSKNRK